MCAFPHSKIWTRFLLHNHRKKYKNKKPFGKSKSPPFLFYSCLKFKCSPTGGWQCLEWCPCTTRCCTVQVRLDQSKQAIEDAQERGASKDELQKLVNLSPFPK